MITAPLTDIEPTTANDAPEKTNGLPVMVPLPDGEKTFGPSRSTLYRLHKAGLIDLVKIGKGTFIVTQSFLRYQRSLPIVPRKAA